MKESGDHNKSAADKAEFQKEIDRTLIRDLEVIELIGLADDPITATRSGITNGLKVAISMDSEGAYVYEALIPFKAYGAQLIRVRLKGDELCQRFVVQRKAQV